MSFVAGASSRYILSSYIPNQIVAGDPDPKPIFEFATLDPSVSDFPGKRVDTRLVSGLGNHAYRWFDPVHPDIPAKPELDAPLAARYRQMLIATIRPEHRTSASDQVEAAVAGLGARVQLLQGPPGTGKTETTAKAILLRILHGCRSGNIVLVAAHTHPAVETLIERVDAVSADFAIQSHAAGFEMPDVKIWKIDWKDGICPGSIVNLPTSPTIIEIRRESANAVLVIGGTTAALLRMVEDLSKAAQYKNSPNKFQVPVLIVDEASMMVFPHFLTLATIVEPNGEIMLAGDHRQLAPIMAHDWEHEDRPPAVLYQPYVSAYQAGDNSVRAVISATPARGEP